MDNNFALPTRSEVCVLVTGGAGFIGSHVADLLMQNGTKVVLVDEFNDYYDVRLKEANVNVLREKYGNKLILYRGDICDVAFIERVFKDELPSHVCHLAARAGVRASIIDPYIYVHSNIEGTTRLLDLARKFSCVNFVYASSSSVYGCSEKEILSESDAVERPVSPYAATKKACELLAYTFHHLYGLNCTGLRFFTVYGPRGRPDMAPFKFIDRVFRGEVIPQYGDGSTSRDYTYIDDIATAVVTAVFRPLGCEVINLGNGRPYLLRDFISLVEKCVGKTAVIQVMPEQPGDVDRTCADISKANKLLDYQPKISFEEGIARMTDWYRASVACGLFESSSADEERERAESGGSTSSTVTHSLLEEKDSAESVGLDLSQDSDNLNADIPSYILLTPHSKDRRRRRTPENRFETLRALSADAAGQQPRLFAREESDLELSSYVQKAETQLQTRTKRFFSNSEV